MAVNPKDVFHVYNLAIGVGQEEVINTVGEFVYFQVASTTALKLGFDDGVLQSFEQGLVYKLPSGERFDRFRIRNESGSTATLEVVSGFGDYGDNRVVLTGGVSVSGTDSFVTAADQSIPNTTATSVLAYNADRRQAIIPNHGAVDLRVGDSNVSASRGIKVAPGGTVILDTKAQIYVYHAAGAAMDVGVQGLEN